MLVLFALLLGTVSCGKQATKRSGDDKTATPTTEATPTGTAAPTAETTSTPTAAPTDAPTGTPTPAPTQTPGFGPAENCAIEFPTRDLYHYDMDLTLDAEAHTIGGHVVFEFYNDTNDTWDKLCLRDYPSLFTDPTKSGYSPGTKLDGAVTVVSGFTDGRDGSAIAWSRDTDVSVLWLSIEKPLAPGEKMTLSYDFTAKIPAIDDRFGYVDGVFNVTNFYPILAEYDRDGWCTAKFFGDGECFYSEVSNYDVRITFPAGFRAATTGTEKGKTETDGTVTYTYEAPCVRDFVFSASDTFAKKTRDCGDVRVNILYPKEYDERESWDAAMERTFFIAENSFAAFGEAFGRYPYEELDIIYTPLAAGGMEYPNLIIIADSCCQPVYVFDDRDTADGPSFYMLDECVSHEIGHQWFMGIVGSNSGMQPWMDESITSYTEVVYAEYLNSLGVAAIRNGFEYNDLRDKKRASELTRNGYLPINKSYYEYSNSSRYVGSIYSTGQTVFYQIELILGHKEFQSVLREYVHRFAFTNAMPEDFFTVLYEFAGTENEQLNALLENCFDLSRLKTAS